MKAGSQSIVAALNALSPHRTKLVSQISLILKSGAALVVSRVSADVHNVTAQQSGVADLWMNIMTEEVVGYKAAFVSDECKLASVELNLLAVLAYELKRMGNG
jgi:hypothetical protein